jgi:hypothetical protein
VRAVATASQKAWQNCQLGFERIEAVFAAGKLHPHEKQTRAGIVVLRGFFNIAAAFEQKARNRVHQAQAVGAGQGQGIDRIHRAAIVAAAKNHPSASINAY